MSIDFLKISRRKFIAGIGWGIFAFLTGFLSFKKFFQKKNYAFSGGIVGANFKVGHLLRTGIDIIPTQTIHINTVIVGGGISGLSAAWWLKKNKFKNFVLLEMDSEVGGNSVSGSNAISPYPWGAHYVPLPGSDAHYVREFFEEIGVIEGYKNGLPIYNEYYLCADSHERLFFQGEWREGLVPQHGLQFEDKRQYESFFSFVEKLKNKKGSDKKYAFSIPMEMSSQDSEFLKYDQVSMAHFMKEQGWHSQYLHWYVNYCCRDDYGMPYDKVSAWAGLHYFASRGGAGVNADSQTVLTWPEGNGFLVKKMNELLGSFIQKNSLVYSIENTVGENKIDVLNSVDQTSVRYLAKNVIFSGPRYSASRVIKNFRKEMALDYAPWVVANISLKQKPEGRGSELAWDNVSFYSKSLGYIVATHQNLKLNRKETVFTYYLPLDERSPQIERIAAYQKSYQEWLDVIVPDLEKMHPGISDIILNIDIWVWGHGMVSPGIDFLWSQKRKDFNKAFHSIEFAHSDMSGISIFEEAQYRGVEAAKKVLKRVRT